MEAMLLREGYEVYLTGDPKEATEIARSKGVDLVLCDIVMPELDGYGVHRELKREPHTAALPLIFVSAHREFAERVEAFQSGVVDFIPKPFTRTVLLRKVERVLASWGLSGTTSSASGLVPRRLAAGVEESPAKKPEPRPAAKPARSLHLEAIPSELRRVLVVDDSQEFRRFVAELLGLHGFTVFEAGDGQEGIEQALAHRPWIILTDMRMPKMNGFELCRQVRSHTLIRHTPVIFISGFDGYKERLEALDVGGDEFLPKTAAIRELLVRMQIILQRYVDLGIWSRKGSGMAGAIEVIGPTSLLHMCHLGRLSGTCHVHYGLRNAQVYFRDGEIVGASCGAFRGAPAVHELMSWTHGRFEFDPGEPAGDPLPESFNQLILEGCRRLDEDRAKKD